jgi:hypothetical protein
VQEGGKWPDKAAECVFRDDHALRMYQREGVNWLVFNWCACFVLKLGFRWAFSLTRCSFKLPCQRDGVSHSQYSSVAADSAATNQGRRSSLWPVQPGEGQAAVLAD